MCGIGSCIGSCCGSAAGACCTNCCASACKCGKSKPNSRIGYLIVMFLGIILALVLRYWGSPLLIKIYYFSYELCDSSRCLGFGAAYRVSFTLFLFFLIHACAMFAKGGIGFHVGYWGAKSLGLIGFLFLTLVIPNSVFDVYSMISRFVSGLFLLVQIIILIDMAYSWQESWFNDERDWRVPILICSLGLFAGSVTLWVFCFQWFGGSGCVRNQFFVGWTIAMTVVFTVLSLSEKTNGGILPAGVVSLYTAYLCYSSLSSDPTSCNTLDTSDTTPVVIGILIAAFSTCYAGWTLSNSKALFGGDDVDTTGDEMEKKAEEAAAGDEEKGGDKSASKDEETPDDEVTRKKHLKFHFVMAACSMYMAMVLTNWGSENSSSVSYNLGEETVWIKIVSQWVTSLLYIWSLVAPILLPDRFASE